MVTLDLQLPRNEQELRNKIADEEHGMAVLRLIKSRNPGTPVAVLTSVAWKDSLMLEFLREGISIYDYIDKHWDDALDRLRLSMWRLSTQIERGSVIAAGKSVGPLHRVALSEDDPGCVNIDGSEIRLSPNSMKVLVPLVRSPNAPVDRDALVDSLWEPEQLSDTFEDNLNTIVTRLRREITEGSGGVIQGKDIIRSTDGAYWLHGMVR